MHINTFGPRITCVCVCVRVLVSVFGCVSASMLKYTCTCLHATRLWESHSSAAAMRAHEEQTCVCLYDEIYVIKLERICIFVHVHKVIKPESSVLLRISLSERAAVSVCV